MSYSNTDLRAAINFISQGILLHASKIDRTSLSQTYELVFTAFAAWRVNVSQKGVYTKRVFTVKGQRSSSNVTNIYSVLWCIYSY